MEPETEKLFQKWLKIQILQYKLAFIKWVLLLIMFVLSSLFFYSNFLPMLTKLMGNSQSVWQYK